jgi:hypothetical protein
MTGSPNAFQSWELQGEMMVLQPFAVKGISRSGIEIESRFALQSDSLHDFRLALGEHSVVVKGEWSPARSAVSLRTSFSTAQASNWSSSHLESTR